MRIVHRYRNVLLSSKKIDWFETIAKDFAALID
jgi:hypothetical protein